MKVVLASNNVGKKIELEQALKTFQVELIPQSALKVTEIAETGLSFIENALIKARHASSLTGLPALSDDSGLVVPALHGAPGIYSARYAGNNATAAENIVKLLSELKSHSFDKRLAYFYCTLVFISFADDPIPLICEGIWAGMILQKPQGKGGFGYDPVFYDINSKKTAAELSLEQKNKISHRGKAIQILKQKWDERPNELMIPRDNR